ncbi:MAG: LamG-like jellyroll fold domain-containing protein, partial [Owenweeksia sp.]
WIAGEDFQEGTTGNWEYGGVYTPALSPTILTNEGGFMLVETNTETGSAFRNFQLKPATSYTVHIDVGSNSATGALAYPSQLNFQVADSTGGSLQQMHIDNSVSAGSYSYTFTTLSGGTERDVYFQCWVPVANRSQAWHFTVDDFKLTKSVNSYRADVLSAQDYYPFGMPLPGGAQPCMKELSCSDMVTALNQYTGTISGGDIDYEPIATHMNQALDVELTAAQWKEALEDCDIMAYYYAFQNANNSIKLPDDAAYHPGTSDFSIEFWINTTSGNTNGTDYQVILCNHNNINVGRVGYSIYLYGGGSSNKNLFFNVFDGPGEAQVLTQTPILSAGGWHHVVAERIGNDVNNFKVYINGQSVNLYYVSNTLNTGDVSGHIIEDMHIGALANTASGGVNFQLNNIELGFLRTYKRALPPSEVTANYNAGVRASASDPTALMMDLPMDEGAGYPVDVVNNLTTSASASATGSAQWFIQQNTSTTTVAPYFAPSTDNDCDNNYRTRAYASGDYRYGFNGMEKDDEIKGDGNSYTTEFRQYDPRLGRWLSLDPIEHPYLSPYNGFDNNPIYWTDPAGSNATKYKTEGGTDLVETDDGSNAVVTVTDDKADAFFESYKDAIDDGTVDSKEWNYEMKSELSGLDWNDGVENTMSYWSTEESRRLAFRYFQTGDIKNWYDAVIDHTATFRNNKMAWAVSLTAMTYGLGLRNQYSSPGSTGKYGEKALAKQVGGTSQKYFKTSQGGRYIDQLADGVAHEAKVGMTSLTNSTRLQIAKDIELIETGQINSSTWHFYRSPVTGKGGASMPLIKELKSNGINVQFH